MVKLKNKPETILLLHFLLKIKFRSPKILHSNHARHANEGEQTKEANSVKHQNFEMHTPKVLQRNFC